LTREIARYGPTVCNEHGPIAPKTKFLFRISAPIKFRSLYFTVDTPIIALALKFAYIQKYCLFIDQIYYNIFYNSNENFFVLIIRLF